MEEGAKEKHREFFWRRLHSFAGFIFLLFVIEHLFTNSQAALFLGDDGLGFVRSVNFLQSLPYLHVLELGLIGLPLAIHIVYGIERIRTARVNSSSGVASTPLLYMYPKNKAFTWQRITSVILIVAIGLHVYYMRFHKFPEKVRHSYEVTLTKDAELAQRASNVEVLLRPKNSEEVIGQASNIGACFWMALRDTYKSIPLCIAYSLFVLIAAFHTCNGLWTFAITWGISLSEKSQVFVRHLSNALMLLLIFFGFAAIWGVYWFTFGY